MFIICKMMVINSQNLDECQERKTPILSPFNCELDQLLISVKVLLLDLYIAEFFIGTHNIPCILSRNSAK